VRVLPGSGSVVVASGGDGKVLIYDHNLHQLHTIDGLDDADNVRLDSEGKLAYVGYGNGAIAVIDPDHGKMIGQIKLDGHPESFQLEAGGNRIFVNVPEAGHVAVVDRTSRSVVDTWQVRAGVGELSHGAGRARSPAVRRLPKAFKAPGVRHGNRQVRRAARVLR
jgi:sugar lactone lactonase YvrE